MTYGNASPVTLVSTIYFDSSEHYYLRRARAGDTSSVKIRAREYMPLSDDAERKVLAVSDFCYLERKERTGTIRDKYRIRITKQEVTPIIERQCDVPGGGVLRHEIVKHSLVPTVISMYERRVWAGGDEVRITFDERVRYYRPPQGLYNEFDAMQPAELGAPAAFGPKRILEVKHPANVPLPPELAELVAELPEATGFSKFLDGMSSIGRSNRPFSLTQPVHKKP